jgi:aspartokinase
MIKKSISVSKFSLKDYMLLEMKRNYDAKISLINQNPEERQMKIDAMRQHYQTILGDIPEEEMNAKISKELALYEMVGAEIPYRTDTTNSD